MSEPLRFWCHDARNIRCVRESDFDAEHALRLSAEVRAKVNAEDCNDAERKLAAAERQVGELQSWQQAVRDGSLLLQQREALQAKLDTAMGLLRRASHEYEHGYLKEHHEAMVDIADFLNTTSTEGKDHE